MTIQNRHAVAVEANSLIAATPSPADDEVTAALLASGRRGAGRGAATPALVTYWRHLAATSVEQRLARVERLRAACRAGETTLRAWIPVALGDHDPHVVREALLGYLGGSPVSLEHRERALVDALEWIRRDLSLNRGALFATLLDQGDGAILERLASLRWRLSEAETHAVWTACAACADAATAEFIAEWKTGAADGASVESAIA